MSDELKDLLTRSMWTFLQAFTATVLVGLENLIQADWKSALVALLVASVAAGFSAVKTYVINRQNKHDK